jgi:hypothetical protein
MMGLKQMAACPTILNVDNLTFLIGPGGMSPVFHLFHC